MTLEEITQGLNDAKQIFERKQKRTLQEFNRTERALLTELHKVLGYKHGDWVVYDGKRYRVGGYNTIGTDLYINLQRSVGSGLTRKTYTIGVKDIENIKKHG